MSRRCGKTDKVIGAAMRAGRRKLGLSQDGVGALIGVTFQQVQKYERGINRLSVTRLLELEDKAGIPIQPIIEAARRSL